MKQDNVNKAQKTNAARLLDAAGIAYELIPYEVDENDLAAGHVAASLGEPIEQVFKTLVLPGDRSIRDWTGGNAFVAFNNAGPGFYSRVNIAVREECYTGETGEVLGIRAVPIQLLGEVVSI